MAELFPLQAATPCLIDHRNDPGGAPHIGPVLLPKRLEHQPLLLPYPEEKQRSEAHESGKARKPVRQQQSLRQRPQEERRIHRVTDVTIQTVGYECVTLPDLKRVRPIAAE